MRFHRLLVVCLSIGALGATALIAASNPQGRLAAAAAISRLESAAGAEAFVHTDRVDGTLRFLRVRPGALALEGSTDEEKSAAFFRLHGDALGLDDPGLQLRPLGRQVDRLGRSRVDFEQRHASLPVFTGRLRTHFDASGRLAAVGGSFVPGIDVSTSPVLDSVEAVTIARRDVADRVEGAALRSLFARSSELMVFRAGRLQRVPGRDHLVWHVEIGDTSSAVREFVLVDAHTGKIVERITGSHTALQRTVHEPDFNNSVIWNEGDTLPYDSGAPANDAQVNGVISTTSTVYDFFLNLSGGTFPSWNGSDGVMHTIWNASFVNCPNASWNGNSTNYCDGTGSDDVVAHEWAHAYTEATHGLIYRWQSGALNESYSDIFGETIDALDGIGTDSPAPVRGAGDCSIYSGSPPPALEVLIPPAIAGALPVSGAGFNPPPPISFQGVVMLTDDGGGSTTGCAPLVGFPPGRIALIDRGGCPFTDKVINAQNAGASGVLIVNTDDGVFSMGGSNGAITIPSLMLSSSDGATLKSQLTGSAVGVRFELAAATADSLRWLMGEDSAAFGSAIRDMWNPTCKGDPDRVGSQFYSCSGADGGGVHTNSGVPNHAFSLLVDGGTFNGQTVAALGTIKAVHLYWRAMTVYQLPDSDFADHETALIAACDDLIGVDLEDPVSGALSGLSITAGDCAAVAAAMAAVEMSAEPPCDFQPLLAPSPPAIGCGAVGLFDDFETAASGWALSNAGVYAEYSPRDWVRTSDVPDGGDGSAWFAIDSLTIGNCIEGDDDQSGSMRLDSPAITLGGAPSLVFDHYVATESDFDGGNLKISVNGGPFVPVAGADFTFNAYNDTLNAAPDNTNPLAGEEAFAGGNGGELGGSWGQSQVALGGYAAAGDSIVLRFEFGVDGCNGLDGWYVDNVLVCTDETGAGSVPDGSGGATALRVDKLPGGMVDVSWGNSCASSDSDFAVYEGAIGSYASHLPESCTTGGATTRQFTPGAGDRYFLVVPRNASREGSYGLDAAGAERPVSAAACAPQAFAYECLP